MEDGRSNLKILIGTPTGKRTLGRPRRKWENNIRMNPNEIIINTRSWVDSAHCCIELPGSISHGVY